LDRSRGQDDLDPRLAPHLSWRGAHLRLCDGRGPHHPLPLSPGLQDALIVRLPHMTTSPLDDTRRRFMTHFAGIGLGATLAPGILWARMQDQGAQRITLEMVTDALKLAG